MSRKQVKTTLEGYDGPIVLVGIDQLNTVLDEVGGTGAGLIKMGKTIEGFKKEIMRPKTEDDYSWFWGLSFKTEKGEIAVLFPWRQDWDKNDGVQLDRSIAFYTKGKVDPREVGILFSRIGLKLLDKWAKRFERHLQSLLENA